MDIKAAFGHALRRVRKSRGLTQEDFGIVSSRTYVSILERGLKSITIDKLDVLANELNIHPISIIALAYLQADKNLSPDDLINQIRADILTIND